jgi:hypothetical protein
MPVIPAPTISTGFVCDFSAKGWIALNNEFGDPNYFVGFPNGARCPAQVLKATQKSLIGHMAPRNRAVTLPTIAAQGIETTVVTHSGVGIGGNNVAGIPGLFT